MQKHQRHEANHAFNARCPEESYDGSTCSSSEWLPNPKKQRDRMTPAEIIEELNRVPNPISQPMAVM